uniref:Chemokine interleukin-8-like domain-containing protein n=1 Tax=Sinocyclocheilus rhinocerous TaxID=307959 RepID=A0A673HVU6_9TELE
GRSSVFLSAWFLKQFVSTAVSFCHAETSQRPSACCLQTSKNRISINRVLSYTVQKAGVCPINAIVLLTVGRKIRCFDPDSEWIKAIMRMVDQKKRTKQNSDPKKKITGKIGLRRQKNLNKIL